MQEEAIFPHFGIHAKNFWERCGELVSGEGYDNELAYMKVMLDTLGMDPPTNAQLRDLGAKLNFYPGLPEMFTEFQSGLLTPEHEAHGIMVEQLHHLVGAEGAHRGQPARAIREGDLRL